MTKAVRGFARTGFSSRDIRGFETAQNIRLSPGTKSSRFVRMCLLSISGKMILFANLVTYEVLHEQRQQTDQLNKHFDLKINNAK